MNKTQKAVRTARQVKNLERVSSQALYQSTIQFSFTVSRKTSRNPTGATSTETTFKSRARSTTASAFMLANTLISYPFVRIFSTPVMRNSHSGAGLEKHK